MLRRAHVERGEPGSPEVALRREAERADEPQALGRPAQQHADRVADPEPSALRGGHIHRDLATDDGCPPHRDPNWADVVRDVPGDTDAGCATRIERALSVTG